MLTPAQKTMKFMILLIAFSLFLGIISYFGNNMDYETNKISSDNRSLGLIHNLIASSGIMAIICMLFYALKLIPQFRTSVIGSGIVMFFLSYAIMTTIVLYGSLGPVNPIGEKYLLAFFVRFWIVLFMPYIDRLLATRFAR